MPVAIHGSSQRAQLEAAASSRRSPSSYGDADRLRTVVEDPTRDQQQEVANEIFTEIRGLYAELDAEGRAGVVRRVRELRRAERRAKGAAPA